MFRIARVHPDAKIPQRACESDAGMDLCACEDVVIPNGERALVDTGLIMEIPTDCYARVAPRSGLAVKHGIQTGAGVVDAGYRGQVKVLLFNHGNTPFIIHAGDRIAQVIFERIYAPNAFEEVPVESLTSTNRGAGGFGSTGTR